MLSIYYSSFSDGSRSAPPKRSTNQETSDDENAGVTRPPRKSVSKRKSTVEKKSKKKKGKETRVNYKTGISTTEYLMIRQGDWYTKKPRDAEITDRRFWCEEQSYIYADIYEDYTNPIRPMNPTKLQLLKDKKAFATAASVIERFELDRLLEFRCPYNVDLVKQFMSTLVISTDPYKTLKWMSGTSFCQAPFKALIEGVGYNFQDTPAIGHRMHVDKPSRDTLMAGMYSPGGVIGKVEGLFPLYGQLVRLFRSFLAPSGGNNDALTSPLVNLLVLAKQCVEDENTSKAYPVDVGDFIFNELYNAMVGGHTIPYAPFIMKLIRRTWKSGDFRGMPMVDHHFKKLYLHREKTVAAPTTTSDSGFMKDARSSATSAAAATAPRPPQFDTTFMPQVRKLSWFQRNILCMKVDIHREQYMSYCRDTEISNSQKLILHRLSGSTDPPPADKATDSYDRWSEDDNTPWVQIEEALRATVPSVSSRAQYADFEEEDEEDIPGAEGESETTAGESSEESEITEA